MTKLPCCNSILDGTYLLFLMVCEATPWNLALVLDWPGIIITIIIVIVTTISTTPKKGNMGDNNTQSLYDNF